MHVQAAASTVQSKQNVGELISIANWAGTLFTAPHWDAYGSQWRQVIERLYAKYLACDCYRFASAVGKSLGRPVVRLDAPDAGWLGHAFVLMEDTPLRLETKCLDIRGIVSYQEIRQQYEKSHGRLVLKRDRVYDTRERFDEPDEVVLKLAGALPWLHDFVPKKYVCESVPERVAAFFAEMTRLWLDQHYVDSTADWSSLMEFEMGSSFADRSLSLAA